MTQKNNNKIDFNMMVEGAVGAPTYLLKGVKHFLFFFHEPFSFEYLFLCILVHSVSYGVCQFWLFNSKIK
jgi:hypothetical protein